LYPKRSSFGLLLLLLWVWPLSASDYSDTNLSNLIKSLQLKEPYATEALFENIASGALSPEVVDRYSPEAALFLGLHAVEKELFSAAERLLRYAAAMDGSDLHGHAVDEFIRLLARQGKWEELTAYVDTSLPGGAVSAYAAVSHARALLETGRLPALEQAVQEYRGLVEGEGPAALQAEFLLIRIKQERRRGGSRWSGALIKLITAFPREDLPLELFAEAGGTNLADLPEGPFSSAERSLLLAKYAYGRREYHSAFAHYHEFMQEAAERSELLTGVITDEFALSGLYSGRTREAYAAAEGVRRSLEAAGSADGEDELAAGTAEAPEEGSALFWLLETEGYLSRKLGRFSWAEGLYTRALKIAPETERQRIRWYIFDCVFRSNTAAAVSRLPEAAAEWRDPDYYTDVVYNLIDRLLSRRQWVQIAEIADALEQSARGVAGARAAYISARAAEAGLIEADGQQIRNWFRIAVRSSWGTGAGLYYRLMSAAALERHGVTVEALQPADFCRILPVEWAARGATRSWQPLGTQDRLIRGYVQFGLAAEAYRRWGGDRGYVDGLQLETVRQWTAALQGQQMYLEAIRMFSRYCRDTRAVMTAADVKLLYPPAYQEFIEPLTGEYELPAHVFYALVREESLFDADISSAAGAVGLSQLMPATAADVAGRIGVRATDLTDPHLNLRLGSWYLAHLIGRTENLSQALFAYNGGITRVRRWVRQSDGLEGDLVLELIPFQETSHYGRKVLVAAIMYGYFYQGIELNRLIESFF